MPMKPFISGLLFQALLVLASLAPARATEVAAVLDICNVGNTRLFVVAIASTSRNTTIDGWQQVDIGDCESISASFHSILGFAVVDASGRKGMQVYDGSVARDPAFIPTETEYCVYPDGNFHLERAKASNICRPGEVLARFAFHVKPKTGETLTLRIPADKDGEVFLLTRPVAFPPFDPITRIPAPEASFQIAMRGLAEQQERLGLRIERTNPPPVITWRAYYIRELGLVARPETHAISVARDSPADKAGVHRGDEMVQFDDIGLKSAWHVRNLLARTKPGEAHTIAFLHSGRLREAKVTLGTLPASVAAIDFHPAQGWLGVEVESAARVVGVAYRDGTTHLELDDDIQKIGRTDFDGVDGLAEWLARNQQTATVELQVSRRSAGKILVMTLDKLD
jgi:hypothetical protein